jgi:O-antigen/teichoic acid export membrane protein
MSRSLTSRLRQLSLRHVLVAHAWTIGSGAALIGGATTVSSISLFIVSVAVGRVAGVTELGRYGLFIAVGSFLGGVVDLGTDRVITQRLAERAPSWRAALSALVIVKATLIAVGAIVALTYSVVTGTDYAWLVLLQAASVTLMLSAQSIAAGLGRLAPYAIVRVLFRLIAVASVAVLVGVFAHRSQIVEYSIGCIAIGDVMAVALLAWVLFRAEFASAGDAPTLSTIRQAFRDALPLGVSSLAVWVYLKLDTVLLALFAGLTTVGAYTAAVRLAELLGGVPTALGPVVLSVLARLWNRDESEFRRARDGIVLISTLVIGICCLAVFQFAPGLISATYRIPASTPYLRLLVWGQLFATVGVIGNVALQISRNANAVAQIAIAVAVLSVPTYGILIPIAGGTGAAAATVALYAAIIPIGLLVRSSRRTFSALTICLAVAVAAATLAAVTSAALAHFHRNGLGIDWWMPFAVYALAAGAGVRMIAGRLVAQQSPDGGLPTSHEPGVHAAIAPR